MKLTRSARLALIAALGVVIAAVAFGVASRGDEGSDDMAAGGNGATGAAMDMVGVDMSTDGSIRLTADQITTFGITFDTADERMLENEVRTVGIVNFDETRVAQVAPKFSGFIERMYVDFTGQAVRRGQPLVEIYSADLIAAQEELLLAAELDVSLGQSSVPGVSAGRSNMAGSAIRRLRLWDISEAQIRELLSTGEVRRTLTLHAPVAGVVIEKSVVQGQAVQAGQPLYTIADLSEVWVEAELREADAGAISEGSAATVELSAFPGRPIQGLVEYIYPTLENQTRTLKARIAIPNPDGRIKPGMYATVRLSSPSRRALAVPTTAVVHTGRRAVVFVDMGGGRISPEEVEVGRATGQYTEILAGLEPGQRVVTSAQYILDSESNIAEVMRSMIGMTGSGEMGEMDMSDPGADMSGMTMPEGSER